MAGAAGGRAEQVGHRGNRGEGGVRPALAAGVEPLAAVTSTRCSVRCLQSRQPARREYVHTGKRKK